MTTIADPPFEATVTMIFEETGGRKFSLRVPRAVQVTLAQKIEDLSEQDFFLCPDTARHVQPLLEALVISLKPVPFDPAGSQFEVSLA